MGCGASAARLRLRHRLRHRLLGKIASRGQRVGCTAAGLLGVRVCGVAGSARPRRWVFLAAVATRAAAASVLRAATRRAICQCCLWALTLPRLLVEPVMTPLVGLNTGVDIRSATLAAPSAPAAAPTATAPRAARVLDIHGRTSKANSGKKVGGMEKQPRAVVEEAPLGAPKKALDGGQYGRRPG